MTRPAAYGIGAIVLLWIGLFSAAGAAQPRGADVPGAADHPALGRIPGSVILAHEHKAFAAMAYPVKIEGRTFESREASGEYWRIVYRLPRDTDPSGALAVYRRNLERAGLRVLWTCRNLSLGRQARLAELLGEGRLRGNPPRKFHCLVAEGELDGRPTVVQVYTYNALYKARPKAYWGPTARLYVLQDKALDDRLQVVAAEEMAARMDDQGHVALYGILFDHDSARLKPESGKALTEIGRYLKAHPGVKVYVVGHTDNTGTYAYNLELSQRRAQAVTDALARRHGIAASRLKPVGVGPVAPVASNATAQGRAKNRRVELVAQ